MNARAVIAVLLIVAGGLVLAYGGFSYTKEETIVDLGPIEATAKTRERVPIPPILGGLALAAGTILLLVRRK